MIFPHFSNDAINPEMWLDIVAGDRQKIDASLQMGRVGTHPVVNTGKKSSCKTDAAIATLQLIWMQSVVLVLVNISLNLELQHYLFIFIFEEESRQIMLRLKT